MSSTFRNNKPLDFTRNEENSKDHIDYFNLKKDRAKEEKQDKVQSFLFVSAAAVFIVVFVAIIYS